MLVRMVVRDNRNAFQGHAALKLNFGENQWSIIEDPKQVWSRVGYSRQGSFELKSWGVIWVRDQAPGGGARTIAIIQGAPTGGDDQKHSNGVARVYEPSNDQFKDATIDWKVDATAPAPAEPAKPLAPIRQKVVDLVRGALLPKPQVLTHGTTGGKYNPKLAKISYERKVDSPSGYTNCGAMPVFVAANLGRASFLTIQQVWKMRETSAEGWVHADPKKKPLPGDIYMLVSSPTKFSHIGVVLDSSGAIWETGDTGQSPDGFSGAIRDRKYKADTVTIEGESTQGGGDRTLAGWVNINTKSLFPKFADGKD